MVALFLSRNTESRTPKYSSFVQEYWFWLPDLFKSIELIEFKPELTSSDPALKIYDPGSARSNFFVGILSFPNGSGSKILTIEKYFLKSDGVLLCKVVLGDQRNRESPELIDC
jgi:hypothetical protein